MKFKTGRNSISEWNTTFKEGTFEGNGAAVSYSLDLSSLQIIQIILQIRHYCLKLYSIKNKIFDIFKIRI